MPKEFSIGKWTLIILLASFAIVIGGMIGSHYYAEQYFHGNGGDSRALFGDSMGAVNALVSAFAFGGMIIAIILQHKELKLQRSELKQQRLEFNTQNKTLKFQRFENTFFSMLSTQQELVNNLSLSASEYETYIDRSGNEPVMDNRKIIREIKGREVFSYTFEKLKYRCTVPGMGIRTLQGFRLILGYLGIQEYEESDTPTYFDHYFRHLYTLIKFIDNQPNEFLTPEEKYKYTSIVRATLSRYEFIWLYYNCLSGAGEKFKPLIETYSLLKNLRQDLLAFSKENRRNITGSKEERKFLTDNGFSGTDFEFFLTDTHEDPRKYHLTAFYRNPDELNEGRTLLHSWQSFRP